MSKKHKTRQDKVIADLRKQLASSHRISPAPVSIPAVKEEKVSYHLPEATRPTPMTKLPLSAAFPVELIRRDLTKTLALTILAISFELILYFVLG